MDLMTPLSAGLIAFASKDMIAKLLGPTFDYIGEGLKEFVEKRHNNVISIFAKANKKLGSKLNQPGEVSPRVLKHVMDEGSFCEDNLTQEYFAGLLASSRLVNKEYGDDKALPYLSTIEQMSANNILFHYVIYLCLIKELSENPINIFEESNVSKMNVYFPIPSVLTVFGETALTTNMSETCALAYKEKLINGYRFGETFEIKSRPDLDGLILKVNPTLYGLTLFLKANAAPENLLSTLSSEESKTWMNGLECHVDTSCLPIIA